MGLGGFIGLSVQAEFLNRSRRHNAKFYIQDTIFMKLSESIMRSFTVHLISCSFLVVQMGKLMTPTTPHKWEIFSRI